MTGAFADLAADVLAGPARLGPVRLVAVDGPAGAGKSTFAARLAAVLGTAGATVHMDDLFAGWHDLPGCWPRVEEWVLAPLRAGRPGRMRRFDWPAGRFGDRWYDVPVTDVLVLEGVGSGRRAAAPDLSALVYVDAPWPVRLRRGLDRDGEALREEWLRWHEAEDAHLAAEGTRARADVVVDGESVDGGFRALRCRRPRH